MNQEILYQDMNQEVLFNTLQYILWGLNCYNIVNIWSSENMRVIGKLEQKMRAIGIARIGVARIMGFYCIFNMSSFCNQNVFKRFQNWT